MIRKISCAGAGPSADRHRIRDGAMRPAQGNPPGRRHWSRKYPATTCYARDPAGNTRPLDSRDLAAADGQARRGQRPAASGL